jgi:hypothetical protein
MHRFWHCLALMSAVLLAFGASAALPGRLMAFETEQGTVTVPGGTTQFNDPDETPLPGLLSSPQLNEDGSSASTGSGTGLQLAPFGQSSTGNPADDRTLIPSP